MFDGFFSDRRSNMQASCDFINSIGLDVQDMNHHEIINYRFTIIYNGVFKREQS